MSKVRILSSEDIVKVSDLDEIISAVLKAYQQKASNQGEDFPLIFHEFKHGNADMDIKSGALMDPSCFGLKIVSLHEDNPKINLPLLMSTTLLFDSQTGQLKGLLNFEHLTGIRTAAAATIGAMLLARLDSEVFLMVGCGHLSYYIIEAMSHKLSNLKTIMIYDPIDIENAIKLQTKLSKAKIKVEVVKDIEAATKKSDIIISATPSREPLIQDNWIKKGTHISCIGADMSGKNEIDGRVLKRSKLYVDDLKQSLNVGEFEVAYKNNLIDDKTLISNIGEVIIDKNKGRTSDDDITIFDSTGISLQDIMVAYTLVNKANKEDIGQEITF